VDGIGTAFGLWRPAPSLDVPIGKRTDPNIRPGWRYGKGPDAAQQAAAGELAPVRLDVTEAFAGPLAADPRPTVRYVPQAGRFGGLLRADIRLEVICWL
jgi:hypothetical protein